MLRYLILDLYVVLFKIGRRNIKEISSNEVSLHFFAATEIKFSQTLFHWQEFTQINKNLMAIVLRSLVTLNNFLAPSITLKKSYLW